MSPTALALVLTAAVTHAAWNLAAGRSRADSTVFVWLYMTGSAILLLPLALVQLASAGWPFSWSLLLGPAVTAVLHVVYSLLLQVGYRRAEVGVVYPVARGVGPLVTMLVAVALLGERPGLAALGGGLIVIAGIAVVTSSALHTRGTRFGPGLRYGVAVGLAIASYTLWDDHAVTDLGLHPLTYFGVAVTFQSLILLPSAVHRRALIVPALRTSWLPAALVAVLSPTAYILVLFAMQTTPVSLVAPLRESSIVIGSLAGWLIFREPKPLRRLAGASVVLGGIALIATA